MPIHTMNFNDGVFFTKTVGYVDNVDGRMWGKALKQHARTSEFPIVAVMDLTGADRLCSTLPRVLADVINEGNLAGVVLVVSGTLTSQQMRVFEKISRLDRVRAFDHIDEANGYAASLLNPGFGISSLHASAFSVAVTL